MIVQTCIVHLLRNSMDFVSWKERKGLTTALKQIYRATDADAAEKALTAFEAGSWGQRYPAIGQLAARVERGHSVLRLPRRGAQDRLHHQRHRGVQLEAQAGRQGQRVLPQRRCRHKAAPSDLEPVGEEWKLPPCDWSMAKAQFTVIFGERFIRAMAA